MKKVYVVCLFDKTDFDVICVFATKGEADEVVAQKAEQYFELGMSLQVLIRNGYGFGE